MTEGSEQENFLFFGYVVGHEAEWGYFRLSELEVVRGPGGLWIERDLYFNSGPPLRSSQAPSSAAIRQGFTPLLSFLASRFCDNLRASNSLIVLTSKHHVQVTLEGIAALLREELDPIKATLDEHSHILSQQTSALVESAADVN